MQKGFIQIPILIAIIIGTAIVGGGGYFVTKEITRSQTTEVSEVLTEESDATSVVLTSEESKDETLEGQAEETTSNQQVVAPNLSGTNKTSPVQVRQAEGEEESQLTPVQENFVEDGVIEPQVMLQKNATILSAIDSFLDNPTATTLRNFCQKAKDLQGWTVKQELSPDRQSMIDVTRTLYEDVPWCPLALNEVSGGIGTALEHYTWMLYSDDFLFPLDNDDDTDTVRKLKIEYNERIKKTSKYKIIGFASGLSGGTSAGSDQHPITVANTLLDKIENQSTSKTGTTFWHLFLDSFIAPEEKLRQIKEEIIFTES